MVRQRRFPLRRLSGSPISSDIFTIKPQPDADQMITCRGRWLGRGAYLAVVRWRKSRDLSLLVALGAAAGCIYMATASNFALMRIRPILGPALLFGLTVISSELPKRWLGMRLAVPCALPLLRSSGEIIGSCAIRTTVSSPTPRRTLGAGICSATFICMRRSLDSTGARTRAFADIADCLLGEERTRIARHYGVPLPLPPRRQGARERAEKPHRLSGVAAFMRAAGSWRWFVTE